MKKKKERNKQKKSSKLILIRSKVPNVTPNLAKNVNGGADQLQLAVHVSGG